VHYDSRVVAIFEVLLAVASVMIVAFGVYVLYRLFANES
jgi:hypothetical protein